MKLLVLCGFVEVILQKNLEVFRSCKEDWTMAEELVVPNGEDEIHKLLLNRGKARQLSASLPGPELEGDCLGSEDSHVRLHLGLAERRVQVKNCDLSSSLCQHCKGTQI